MSKTVKQDTYRLIREEFRKVTERMKVLKETFRANHCGNYYIFIHLNENEVDPRQNKIQPILEELEGILTKLKYDLQFILEKTNTQAKKKKDYSSFLEEVKIFETELKHMQIAINR